MLRNGITCNVGKTQCILCLARHWPWPLTVTVIFDRVFVSFCTPRSRIGAYTRSKCISFIKTTASIPTKFSTTLNTTMRLSWVVQIRAKGIQDGGRLPVKPPNLNLLFEFCYKGYYGSGSPYSCGDELNWGRHSEYDAEWHFQHNIY